MNPSQSSAAAAGGVAGAVVVIVCWALALVHVTVPGEVASAMTVLTGALTHGAALKFLAPRS